MEKKVFYLKKYFKNCIFKSKNRFLEAGEDMDWIGEEETKKNTVNSADD